MQASRFHDLGIRPQILHDIPLATFYLAADPAVTAPLLPRGLAPAPDGRIILNIWSHSDPNETTGFGGFGPMGIAYFAVEVAGEPGSSIDGKTRFPARCWMHHWCDYAPARSYAAEASGLTLEPGQPKVTIEDGRLSGVLELDGHPVIAVSATVGSKPQGVRSGFSAYYAERRAMDGSAEVARFEIPWVGEGYSAEQGEVDLMFQPSHPAPALFGGRPPEVLGVTFRRMTLVPYLASTSKA